MDNRARCSRGTLAAAVLAAALAAIAATRAAVAAPTLVTDRPGNLFTAGESIAARLDQAQGEVRWEVLDWKGQRVADGVVPAGDASGVVRLPELAPGYYEVQASDSTGRATMPMGVVMDRGDQPLDKAGRIGVDAALAWCVTEDLRPKAVQMVRRAGIPWVRERLGWADVEREPGKIAWGHYDAVATLFHAEGISISQVVDFGPHWANGGSSNPPPRDLAAVCRFFRAASRQFAKRVQAWELWNEVDNGWPATADAYASVFKAAALGVRDGDPNALVLPASLSAHGKLPFQENLAECELSDYFDVLNMHRYHDPYGQEPTVHELACMFGPKPVWLTETNQLQWLNDGRGDGQVIFQAEQQRGASYLPKAAALSLAAGIERMFIFMLPHRVEGAVQFGLLRPDLTPYPEFVALSAAANVLGRGTYLGRLPLADGGDARLFRTPTGTVVAAWANTPSVVPVHGTDVRVLDLFGADRIAQSASSPAGIPFDGEPIYIVGSELSALEPLVDPPTAALPAERGSPSHVVMAPLCSLPIAKRHNWYSISPDRAIEYQVQVWNLDESQKADARVSLHLPAGWTADRSRADVTVPPMASQTATFQLQPAAAVLGPERLLVEGECAGEKIASVTSWFGREPAAVTPTQLEEVVHESGPDWELVPSAGPSTVSLERAERGVVRIKVSPSATERRAITLSLALGEDARLDQFDGLLVTVEPATVKPSFRMTIRDAQGALWACCPCGAGHAPGSQLLLFRDMDWQWQSAPAFTPGLRGAQSVQLSCEFAAPVETFTIRAQAAKYP